MNKYILMLGVAALSLAAYAVRAGNSDTMTVSATIAHDVNLSVSTNMSFALTVDPSKTTGWYQTGATPTADGTGVLLAQSSSTRGVFSATTPSGYSVSKFTITPATLTGDVDSHVTVGNFAVVAGATASGTTTYYVDGKLSYTASPKASTDYDFGSVTITYVP
ncbi:MAG: hypothetical protein IJ689_01240 [Alphaproteobacteria bacterium]|nr:hypothetical protein [Alphaproteobacteria bacterium]